MRLLAAFLVAASLWGQPPALRTGGIMNAASRIPSPLPGAGLARGALIDIFGVRLGSSPQTTVAMLWAAGASIMLPVISVSPQHVVARIPANAPLGEAKVTLAVNGAAGAPLPVRVVASGFGIFSRNQEGWGPGVIRNIDTRGARSDNTLGNSARPGQSILLSGTGMGEGRPEFRVGGRIAKIEAIHRGATEEVTLRLAPDTPQGCYVPVVVRQPSGALGNSVTLAVKAGGGACDPPSSLPVAAWTGGSRGLVVLTRTVKIAEHTTIDEGLGVFAASKDGETPPSQALLVPPLGTCTAYTNSTATNEPATSMADAMMPGPRFAGRDAGDVLTVARGNLRLPISGLPAVGAYRRSLGESRNGRSGRLGPLFLEPGQLLVASRGGTDVGSFSLLMPSPEPFAWENAEALRNLDRQAGASVRWKPPAQEGTMTIAITAVDPSLSAWSAIYCTAPASAGGFEIPSSVLANLPFTDLTSNAPPASFVLSYLPQRNQVPLQAPGLDRGMAISLYSQVQQSIVK